MTNPELELLRFPIGRFKAPEVVTGEMREEFIADIRQLPGAIRAAVDGLSETQLDTPYREGGWTVRQVLHHVPDSHINALIRFKLALTEDSPTATAYNEARFAELGDVATTPISTSLAMLDALHVRWEHLLRSMSDSDFERSYLHPQYGRHVRLDSALALYSWHSRHHVAHITSLRKRNGW